MTSRQKRREEDDIYREHPVTTWERHGQSIIAAVVLLVLSWVGINVSDGVRNDAVMATEVSALKLQVAGLETTLKTDMQDRYRGRDAERDFQAVYKELNRVRDDNGRFMAEQSSRGPRIKALEHQMELVMSQVNKIRMGTK